MEDKRWEAVDKRYLQWLDIKTTSLTKKVASPFERPLIMRVTNPQ
ncbi:hypothetical protein Lpp22_0219 [Lacticaseibacillus paracasei subsp. paracasei Lpp22]|uniref:Uncharacterized protein n=1 Tax=Lacticaseibacillus paracasei subsp. paracasei Lpp22 TaxID=1256221 RepID=A0A8E0IBZ8_LACPA|nr:hypothetical protein Lpp22_0219 [Lacticaseibacillus paracasei subsp. paracasei Lpp22]